MTTPEHLRSHNRPGALVAAVAVVAATPGPPLTTAAVPSSSGQPIPIRGACWERLPQCPTLDPPPPPAIFLSEAVTAEGLSDWGPVGETTAVCSVAGRRDAAGAALALLGGAERGGREVPEDAGAEAKAVPPGRGGVGHRFAGAEGTADQAHSRGDPLFPNGRTRVRCLPTRPGRQGRQGEEAAMLPGSACWQPRSRSSRNRSLDSGSTSASPSKPMAIRLSSRRERHTATPNWGTCVMRYRGSPHCRSESRTVGAFWRWRAVARPTRRTPFLMETQQAPPASLSKGELQALCAPPARPGPHRPLPSPAVCEDDVLRLFVFHNP